MKKLHYLYLNRRIEDGNEKGYLQNKDSRHTINKIPMPRFMAESMHTDDTADASANNRDNE